MTKPNQTDQHLFNFFKRLHRINLRVILTITCITGMYISGFSQQVTLVQKNATLKQIFSAIQKQTGYDVVFSSNDLYGAEKINANFVNAGLEEVLHQVLKNLPLTYILENKTIIVHKKKKVKDQSNDPDVAGSDGLTGIINGETGPLSGVSVVLKKTGKAYRSAEDGSFHIAAAGDDEVLVFSYIGYEKLELRVKGLLSPVSIRLKQGLSVLEEVHVLAYGEKTSKRNSTGSTVGISSDVLEKTPTADPLAALQGRAAGVLVTINSGMPGAQVKIQIRGTNTLNTDGRARNPLYIVDGVPFVSGSMATLSNIGQTWGSSYDSPFKSIDPASIANIEILKDADATAIYGARAANGVVLITTKRGKGGKLSVNADVYHMMARVPKFVDMMNTEEYLMMRRQAALRSGVEITEASYPDLTKWSQNKYTNWQKEFFGKTARSSNAELNLSGGTDQIRFMLGGGYRDEKTVYNDKDGLKIANGRVNVDYNSKDQKLTAALSLNYASDRNSAIALDPSSFYNLPPNFSIYNEEGSLNWSITNPVAASLRTMMTKSKNLNSNLLIGYKVLPDLNVKASLGYNNIRLHQTLLNPIASQDPGSYNPMGNASFVNNDNNSFTFEPHADYVFHAGKSTFNVLIGGTYIDNKSENLLLSAFSFVDDAKLGDISAAGAIDTSQTQNQYRFLSAFTRLGYNYNSEYILNFTLRRDGSSRFAPDSRFGNFYSIGAAWIFSKQPWLKEQFSFLSFGKLRGSYGLTGNDNVGDFAYYMNYIKTYSKYQNVGLYPNNLFNAGYQWEKNKKMEFALELGFMEDRITFTTNYYRNRSGNQLISYPLSGQAGLSSVVENLDALVQNSGWEFTMNAALLSSDNFKWKADANLTFARNKLLAFPGLSGSSYSKTYEIGKSLNLLWDYEYLGINPENGNVMVKDVDGNGTIDTEDRVAIGNLMPSFYGGLNNSFSYKRFELNVFFSFKKGSMGSSLYLSPGADAKNQPRLLLDRWQLPGQVTDMIPYTTNYTEIYHFNSSRATLYNNSYIRLSNVSFSYDFSKNQAGKLGLKNLHLYVLANNLFTITKYPGLDPESGISMPLLRSVTLGLRTTF
jgi:TonB-linked SusC/RagA family outer membrane protein